MISAVQNCSKFENRTHFGKWATLGRIQLATLCGEIRTKNSALLSFSISLRVPPLYMLYKPEGFFRNREKPNKNLRRLSCFNIMPNVLLLPTYNILREECMLAKMLPLNRLDEITHFATQCVRRPDGRRTSVRSISKQQHIRDGEMTSSSSVQSDVYMKNFTRTYVCTQVVVSLEVYFQFRLADVQQQQDRNTISKLHSCYIVHQTI